MLIGPRGATLAAIQELTRTVAQRLYDQAVGVRLQAGLRLRGADVRSSQSGDVVTR